MFFFKRNPSVSSTNVCNTYIVLPISRSGTAARASRAEFTLMYRGATVLGWVLVHVTTLST